MNKSGRKLLTLELDMETLAEFSAAAKVFGARSKSTFMNQYVVEKIRQAKQTVSKDEFSKLVAKQMEVIQERSERKSQERKKREPIKGKKEVAPQLIKSEIPVAEKLNFSGKKPSRKRISNEDAINKLIDKEITKKKS